MQKFDLIIVGGGLAGVDHVTTARHQQPLRAALASSFAFGGSNAVLAFRAVAAQP